jgi:cob(I)alamin adenosyltransferase
VPGQELVAAQLDVARTVVPRAERDALAIADDPATQVIPYLNRLSDLCWTLARWREAEVAGGSLASRAT